MEKVIFANDPQKAGFSVLPEEAVFVECPSLKCIRILYNVERMTENYQYYEKPSRIIDLFYHVSDDITLEGNKGSEVDYYAEERGITFVPIDCGTEEVVVTNEDELREAIGSLKKIILKDGVYSLPNTLYIDLCYKCDIEAEHPGKCEILVENGFEPVIEMYECKEVIFVNCCSSGR